LYVCTYVRMYVCTYVRMYVCICVCVSVCVCACVYKHTHTHTQALASCSQEATLFSLVAPFWESNGRFYFFLLPYLAGAQPTPEAAENSDNDARTSAPLFSANRGLSYGKRDLSYGKRDLSYGKRDVSPDLPRITTVWTKRCSFPNVAGVHVPGVRYFGNAGGMAHVRQWQPAWTSGVLVYE
jgi:hypothetical protein